MNKNVDQLKINYGIQIKSDIIVKLIKNNRKIFLFD